MSIRTAARRGLIAAGASVVAVAALVSPASAEHAAGKPIHPGIMTFTEGGQCTANFVFTDANGTYIGQAAHCAGTGGATETDGCDSGSLPIGTPVELGETGVTGTLAYSSWIAMQKAGEKDENTCAYNDFALVKIPAEHVGKVSPEIPFWGGPKGLDTNGTTSGERVLSYGNSSLRGGAQQLSPKEGVSLGSNGGGWNHPVYTASPGIPGDSGSAFIDADGDAIGVLVTLQVAPLAGSNGVTDMSKALAYAKTHGFPGLTLSTAPFSGGGGLPLLGGLLGGLL